MFNESFPSGTNIEAEGRKVEVEVMRHGADFDPENMDVKYEKIYPESREGSSLINDCDWLLANCYEDKKSGKNAESFVGSGFHAVVLRDTKRKFCMKVTWDMLLFDFKLKPHAKSIDFPDRLAGLQKVYQYFNGSETHEGIKQRKRKLISAGAEYKTQNDIETEAKITEYVYDQFSKIGMKDVTPKVLSIFKYKNEESGETENIKGYAVSEDMNAIHMGYIDGVTIEQLVLENPDEFEKNIDVEKFVTELKRMVEALHGFGVTHGDLTIRNVMIDRNTFMPRIIDFGAAQYSKSRLDPDEVNDDFESVDMIHQLLQKYRQDPQKAEESLKERRNKL